jgi:hypothetical protein
VSEAATYFKCACERCAGRIEFPAEAVGATVDCPHCGWKTTLVAPESPHPKKQFRRIRKRILLPVAFALIGSLLLLSAIARPRPLVVGELHFERASTNSPGSITGVIENKSRRAKRNVRIEIDLLNSRGEKLWQATDYTAEVGAKSRWNFRALVLDPNVVTGRVARVTRQ